MSLILEFRLRVTVMLEPKMEFPHFSPSTAPRPTPSFKLLRAVATLEINASKVRFPKAYRSYSVCTSMPAVHVEVEGSYFPLPSPTVTALIDPAKTMGPMSTPYTLARPPPVILRPAGSPPLVADSIWKYTDLVGSSISKI
ncbi:hypothetical protein Pmar_PMAR013515 [Perkinsus marinus ATCC 50983]|uniref:Uncharacterized protein n=1 Tax=Perkinsus marinus (strain ATCC 50983 / TXsc) TaxID=423536 RepID=C5L5E3_PERM5|nr:hypothetical protein Pmar_PMAR013515 [Perkinsus marinus ATCC 50983]EER08050.1 hypothetical protein Pmar_PMAR013515 [Perkinsus marinus ATCC 50983]|eukprot:XP_002776234.1 hypothetical protein Pmar_PMAR013515 [Perkinsus marinus ATCC 50983]